jgi:uncharacterized membrane protein
MRPSPTAFVIAIFVAAIPLVHAGISTASCTFTTFTAPNGYTIANVAGIDDHGNVVGQLQNKNGDVVAFTRAPNGTFTTYSVPNSYTTGFSHRINSGVTVGTYQDNQNYRMHGFALSGGNLVAVNYPKAVHTQLYGINSSGTVVGGFTTGVYWKGFRLANGAYKSIAYPGAVNTILNSINDGGLIVGYYMDATMFHGLTWQSGTFRRVDFPNAKYGTVLNDVNKSGVIVGNRYNSDFAFGFIYQNGSFAKIVYSGAKAAAVGGININGVISGQLFFTASNQPGYTAVCK